MNDTRSILLVNDNLKKFDQAWEESLMALEKEPEEDPLEGLYHRRVDKSIITQNALALHRFRSASL